MHIYGNIDIKWTQWAVLNIHTWDEKEWADEGWRVNGIGWSICWLNASFPPSLRESRKENSKEFCLLYLSGALRKEKFGSFFLNQDSIPSSLRENVAHLSNFYVWWVRGHILPNTNQNLLRSFFYFSAATKVKHFLSFIWVKIWPERILFVYVSASVAYSLP